MCSYMCMRLLTTAPMRQKMVYTRSYFSYSAVCIQRTLSLLLAILMPNLGAQQERNGILQADFLSKPAGLTTGIISFNFVLTTGEHRFLSKKQHWLARCSPPLSHYYTYVSHIPNGRRWREPTEDWRSFRSTSRELDNTLLLTRFSLRLSCCYTIAKTARRVNATLADSRRLQF